ncbi:MAG: TRAP transporter small permease subunit [Gammaproteobacteria bacterium]|nr:TRAP transporter small permease subunit [Gammaproteobacteria bacterium]
MLASFKQFLVRLETFIAAVSLSFLLLFAVIQIIARNVFETGFPVLDVISRHLVLFVTFMGAALATEYNKHIKIDVLANIISEKTQKKCYRPFLGVSALVCFILGWYAGLFWLDEWKYAPINEQWSVYLALILPGGFFLLGLHFILLTLLARKNYIHL